MAQRIRRAASPAVLIVGGVAAVGGCQSDAQSGALIGAGIGALAGQAIGGDTEATLLGAAAGGGAGYIVGNERDKAKTRREAARPTATAAPAPSRAAPVSNSGGALVGTRWSVVNLVRDGAQAEFVSMRMIFERGGRFVTSTHAATGETKTSEGAYSVVGDTLLLEDEYGGMINATYQLAGDRLIISAPNYRAILERAP